MCATIGRWSANQKPDSPGLWIEWALDGEGLYRGDRLIEVNGKLVISRTRDELQRLIGANGNGKCQLVVVRKRNLSISHQQLIQFQEDNLRLQHRISYLEEHVRELQINKENGNNELMGKGESHVTSISISSPPSTPPQQEKPQIFQRGNFVTTIVGGKAVDSPPSLLATSTSLNSLKNHITKTIIKENNNNKTNNNNDNNHSFSSSSISIQNDFTKRRDGRHLYSNGHSDKNLFKTNSENTNHFHNSQNYNYARSAEFLNYQNRFVILFYKRFFFLIYLSF